MAVYYARKAGNVNATDVWATTPSGTAGNFFPSFTNADTLMSNSFAVTLNVNTTVLEIKNDTSNGATAGGGFTINNGVTLTANVVGGVVSAFLLQVASNATCSIVGSITGAGASFAAVLLGAFGTVTITGNVTGGTSSSDAVGVAGSGVLNVIGNISGGGTLSTFAAIANRAAATVTITGTVVGGITSVTGYGAINASTGTLTIIGTAIGGSQGAGVLTTSSASGATTVTRAKGNGFGNGSVGLASAVGVAASQSCPIRVFEIEYGDLGQSPTSGPIILTDATSNVALVYRTSGGKKTLVDSAATADYPAISNVRSGTVFANGNRTGTMVVPPASSVVAGVAVDNTVGTAVLNSSAAQTAFDSALSGFSSGRLGNCATVASTGQQLANALTG